MDWILMKWQGQKTRTKTRHKTKQKCYQITGLWVEYKY